MQIRKWRWGSGDWQLPVLQVGKRILIELLGLQAIVISIFWRESYLEFEIFPGAQQQLEKEQPPHPNKYRNIWEKAMVIYYRKDSETLVWNEH